MVVFSIDKTSFLTSDYILCGYNITATSYHNYVIPNSIYLFMYLKPTIRTIHDNNYDIIILVIIANLIQLRK